ncbi:hypothetical protein DMH01_14930 [Amycolatopsis sp. WAC 04182]|uniref:hypothetical protein n=1 Tax=Amycolatopsis sp. WAC 04182 TaxID=2203198 RepID=UPI000F7A7FF6|nr:hypothetical protein [Amycolatopsis sp. WAC 04182]RSN60591.1 hypothetical protein DMH01_14930 [Amycolatopsis sp. WAC 04182]
MSVINDAFAELDLMFVNFDHGGASSDQSVDYCMDGLVELVGADDRWPDLGVIAETNFWRFFGNRGHGAAEVALNTVARDRNYVLRVGSLPGDWGAIGPALLYDASKVLVHEWHGDPRDAGFLGRNRNRAVISPRDLPERKMDLFATHGHPNGDLRLQDVDRFRPYGTCKARPAAVLADWFGHPSGPEFEPASYAKHFDEIAHYAPRMLFPDGIPMPGDHPFATSALDFLCGRWVDDRRIGGVGFQHVGELARVYTPTNFPALNGRPPTQIDGAVLNPQAAEMLVPGSVQVHEPVEPNEVRPGRKWRRNDHKRFLFALRFSADGRSRT